MSKLILETGRPADFADRLPKEQRTYELLDELGVIYQRIDHEAAMTMEACADIDEALDAMICKNLFLTNRQETDFYLLLIPGDKKFKTKELSAQLGISRLSFANEEWMEKFLDITPGSVSVMGLMNDKEGRVRLVIDEDVLDAEYYACHPCINTSSLRFSMDDFKNKVIPALSHEPTYVNLPGERISDGAKQREIVGKMMDLLKNAPDGYSVTTQQLLIQAGYKEEIPIDTMFEIHELLFGEVKKADIKLDMSSHDRKEEGLPFHLDFIVKHSVIND